MTYELKHVCESLIKMSRSHPEVPATVLADKYYADNPTVVLQARIHRQGVLTRQEAKELDDLKDFFELVVLVARQSTYQSAGVAKPPWSIPGILHNLSGPALLTELLVDVYKSAWELRNIYIQQLNGYADWGGELRVRHTARVVILEPLIDHVCHVLGFRTVHFNDDARGPAVYLDFQPIEHPERHSFSRSIG